MGRNGEEKRGGNEMEDQKGGKGTKRGEKKGKQNTEEGIERRGKRREGKEGKGLRGESRGGEGRTQAVQDDPPAHVALYANLLPETQCLPCTPQAGTCYVQ